MRLVPTRTTVSNEIRESLERVEDWYVDPDNPSRVVHKSNTYYVELEIDDNNHTHVTVGDPASHRQFKFMDGGHNSRRAVMEIIQADVEVFFTKVATFVKMES